MTLTVQPAVGAAPARDVRLVRELVQVESVQGDRRRVDGTWEWWLEGEPGVAYVRITGFGERTAAELDRGLDEVAAGPAGAGVPHAPRGLVIDLRGNPGGLVTAAVDVCDRFLDDGVIVSTCGRREAPGGAGDESPTDVRRATPGAVVPGLPIAILVDDLTASAAEIVAACLQDHRRATIVGGRTFGKGTVQSILPLTGGGLLKLTTAEYLRPDGRTIDRSHEDADGAGWGVVPDDGYALAPASDSLDRLDLWRKLRDAHPAVAPPGRAMPKPRAIDEVLARAIDAFPVVSPPRTDLRGEEETPRDADDASPSGV